MRAWRSHEADAPSDGLREYPPLRYWRGGRVSCMRLSSFLGVSGRAIRVQRSHAAASRVVDRDIMSLPWRMRRELEPCETALGALGKTGVMSRA